MEFVHNLVTLDEGLVEFVHNLVSVLQGQTHRGQSGEHMPRDFDVQRNPGGFRDVRVLSLLPLS